MIEALPIRSITEEDGPIFGSAAVKLGKLSRMDFPVALGLVVTAPELKLKTVLEHFDFGIKEVIEQSLTLVKKEILSIPVPEKLEKETIKHKRFYLDGSVINGVRNLWKTLLNIWIEEIRVRLWNNGFYPGITESLDSQIVSLAKKVEGFGTAYFDSLSDDVLINIKSGKIEPKDQRKIYDLVQDANKKLFLPQEYEWIIDGQVKITGIKQYTPPVEYTYDVKPVTFPSPRIKSETVSAVKVFLDLSAGLVVERDVDGIYIAAEKIFDLNKPRDSFENLVFKTVESAITFPENPILFKLADKSEGMGKIRGTLRLLHQRSLLEPMIDTLDFVRHKKGLTNIHIVAPFVRTQNEFLQIKRELTAKKLGRKNSLQLWLEIATPENIINLEDYLVSGLDGVVLNLDEMSAYFNGYDHTQEELLSYKNGVSGLLKFLDDGLKLLNKSKTPFLIFGSLALYPEVLEFLVEKGVYGIVVEKYEAHSAKDLLHQTEKRIILRTS